MDRANPGRIRAAAPARRPLPVASRVVLLVLAVLATCSAVAVTALANSPFAVVVKLGPQTNSGGSHAGTSVAASARGGTVLVGAPGYHGGYGRALVYVRVGCRRWRIQRALLPVGGAHGRFGSSVALSANGNVALVGADGDGRGRGLAWVFVREGGHWVVAAKLAAPKHGPNREIGKGLFGSSVALSSTGLVALIGAEFDDGFVCPSCHAPPSAIGAAWLFDQTAGKWTMASKLTAPTTGPRSEVGDGQFGASVALSGSGTAGLIGAPDDSGDLGAAWSFSGSGPLTKLSAPSSGPEAERRPARVGLSVALASTTGETALLGSQGAAWVFTLTASGWTPQQRLAPPSAILSSPGFAFEFGGGVALSGNGDTALIGGPESVNSHGRAFLYTNSSGAWGAARTLAPPASGEPRAIGKSRFGASVALSTEGALPCSAPRATVQARAQRGSTESGLGSSRPKGSVITRKGPATETRSPAHPGCGALPCSGYDVVEDGTITVRPPTVCDGWTICLPASWLIVEAP